MSGGSLRRDGGDRPRAAGSAGTAARAVILRSQRGQVAVLLVGGLMAVLVGAFVLGAVARGVGRRGEVQRAADLAALAGARTMRAAYPRLFEPAMRRHRPNPRHLERDDYLRLGRDAAERVAAANGARGATVRFPERDSFAPVRIRVTVSEDFVVGKDRARQSRRIAATAEAELAPPNTGPLGIATGGGYEGPLAYRQGKAMRPDVARAFDRMERAANADGVTLAITSGYRSDAEQAVLWNRHPDPRWVARPGTSLHRNATELDLGPPAAYGWLARNAERFHFTQRYSWEPWHYGYTLNAHSTPSSQTGDGAQGRSRVPGFVPERFAPMLRQASQRWNVSVALLAAQIYVESKFNPWARSRVGAIGISQFMPGTARAYGIDPRDPEQAIDAQGHMMRDLLREFGSVTLALAAYNAGPAAVRGCGCIPYAETRAYVAQILGLMNGAGEPLTGGDGVGLEVRLVE